MSFHYHALSAPSSASRLEATDPQTPIPPRLDRYLGGPQHHVSEGTDSHESLLDQPPPTETSSTFDASDSAKGRLTATVTKNGVYCETRKLSPEPMRATLLSWALEVGAMLLSIASVVTIVTVLHRENDKSLDRWSPAISLNTVVSTLGTLARTTLAFALSACVGQQRWSWLYNRSDGLVAFERFDGAVRGPWGGTRLFVWLRARHWAALGALVIMGTVAFDPFLQAVISNQGRLDDIGNGLNTTINQARAIDTGSFVILDGAGLMSMMTSAGRLSYVPVRTRPDFGLVGSIYNGLRNTSISREETARFTCVSGNCTWPVFATAAVCSSCVDVSADLESTTDFGWRGTSIPWTQLNVNLQANYTSWQVGNNEIRNFYGMHKPVLSGFDQTTLMTLNTTTNASMTLSFQETENLLMAFTFLTASPDYVDLVKPWEETTPIATECAWSLCVNAYKARSINNELTEELVGSWSQRKPGSYGPKSNYSWYDGPNGLEVANAAVADMGNNLKDYSIIRDDLQLLIPADEAESLGLHDRFFNVSQAFIYSTIAYLDQITYKQGNWDSHNVSTRKIVPGSDVVGYPSADDSMPAIADAFWNSRNLNTTFKNVARSITLQLRNASPDKQVGTMQQWVIHVKVNWWYLVFPVAMLTLGLVYVTLVIVESTRLRIPVWKESTYPTLLYGLNDETQRLLREEVHSKKMATTVRYRMDEKEDCLRLIAD